MKLIWFVFCVFVGIFFWRAALNDPFVFNLWFALIGTLAFGHGFQTLLKSD